MSEQRLQQTSSWTRRRDEKERRMQAVMRWMSGPVLPTDKTVEALEALVVAGDRIVLEGDNQKQADFLSRSLVKVDAKKIHDHSYSRTGSLKLGRFTLTSSCTLACWSISSQTSSLCVQSRRTARAIFLRNRILKTHLSSWRLRLSTTRS